MDLNIEIGEVVETSRIGADEVSVELWIRDFLSLTNGIFFSYISPSIRIGDEIWYFAIRPNWAIGNMSSGWLWLGIHRKDCGPPETFHCSVGIRGSEGVEKRKEVKKEFSIFNGYFWANFCSRSYLMEHRTRLMADGVLRITCVFKRLATTRVSHGNYSNPFDMPLANPKDQTLPWQQNSYMIDSGSNIHVMSHGNYSNPFDMPLANPKDQTLPWQQNSYMIDSGSNIHAPPPSPCGEEDDLDSDQIVFDRDQPGFRQGFTQVDEMNQQPNQTRSQRVKVAMFDETLEKRSNWVLGIPIPTQPTALIQFLINYKNKVDVSLTKIAKHLKYIYPSEDDVVWMVYKLFKEEASRHAIMNSLMNSPRMVVELVHAMTSSNDLRTTKRAVDVLYNLSRHKQGLLAILKSSSIPALVKLLSFPEEIVLFYAISILHSLLCFQDESRMAVRLAGGLQKMVTLLQHNNVEFLAIVTYCLYILAYENQESKLIILASGGPAELVRIMRSYTSKMLLWTTSCVLKVISVCSSNKPVLKLGIVKADVSTQTDSNIEDEGSKRAHEDFSKLFASGEYSDVTVQVGDVEFRVHSLILLARSPALSASLRHECTEKVSGRIVIEDCEPEVFREFLHYLYTGSPQLLTEQNVFGLYRVADKYLADDLKRRCLKHLWDTLSAQTFCDTIKLALAHGESRLFQLATDFAANGFQSIASSKDFRNFNFDFHKLFLNCS